MEISLIQTPITHAELAALTKQGFGDFIKAVVDLQRHCMVVGGELHADEEAMLLAQGSHQQDLWGINLYPGQEGDACIEFDSMINIRPSQGNRSRGVENVALQKAIRDMVAQLVVG